MNTPHVSPFYFTCRCVRGNPSALFWHQQRDLFVIPGNFQSPGLCRHRYRLPQLLHTSNSADQFQEPMSTPDNTGQVILILLFNNSYLPGFTVNAKNKCCIHKWFWVYDGFIRSDINVNWHLGKKRWFNYLSGILPDIGVFTDFISAISEFESIHWQK